jgi:hypothetical protein
MTTEDNKQRRRRRWDKADSRVLIDGRMVAVDAPNHGSTSTYGNWQCRCWPCTKMHSASQAEWRAMRRTRRQLIDGVLVAVEAARHCASTYTNWGCRCRICTDAFTADCAHDKQQRDNRRAGR